MSEYDKLILILTEINLKRNQSMISCTFLKLQIWTHHPAGNEKAGTQGSNMKPTLFWRQQLHAVHALLFISPFSEGVLKIM
jgi:hypothetical protein